MKLRYFLFFFVLILVSSCKKNNNHPVPNIAFDMVIDINLPSYNALIGVGNWSYVNGGSRGIIVYRKSIDEFVAFDRHSPADAAGTCPQPLIPELDNFLTLVDSCSSATFSLYDGSPISGSDFGLRMYQTSFDGASLLRIFN